MATPTTFIEFSRQRGLSPEGRCKAFSADANGAGWGEGAGMLLLERVSDARRNGHPVLAVLRGSAVNQDGRSQGLTAPNGPSQQRVIAQALANAGLGAADIDAVEAHGTGTTLGDPIEAQALIATYGKGRGDGNPLWLGSLKSNIGHTQAAAGVGGIIKMVLAMQHETLPQTLHAATPSPHVDWSDGTVRLLNDPMPWKRNGHLRRAGVSSFGISGTNAHVIIEEAPALAAGADDGRPDLSAAAPSAVPVVVSGKTAEALRAQAARLRDHVVAHPELALVDLAFSLATTRTAFEQRAAVVAADHAALLQGLDALAKAEPAPNLVLGQIKGSGKSVFVFPGQGAQWEGMAVDLLQTSDVFRAEINACAEAFAPYADWSLLDVLRGRNGASALDRVDVVQPVNFAVMVSLAALWRSVGVEPEAVVGHSQGEIAAAYVAGALSLQDAAAVVTLRSRALVNVAGRGAMAAIQLAEEAVRERMTPWGDRVSVAAVNSPHSTVISGEPAAIDALLAELTAANVFVRKIRVDYASHSAQVEEIRDELLKSIAAIRPRPAAIPLYSTLSVESLADPELDADYWYRNLRETVRFAQATQKLLSQGHRFFVEMSPHPVLTLALADTAEAADTAVEIVGSLRRDEGDMTRFLLSLAELGAHGFPIDWAALFAPFAPRRVDLPTYAFQRQRYWLEASAARGDIAAAGVADAAHPLLGTAIPLADSDAVLFTGRLSLATHPWLAGHKVFDHVILPGTGFVELALFAAQHVGLERVEELTLEAPLVLPDTGAVLIQLSVGIPDAERRRSLILHARAEESPPDMPWTRHATGALGPAAGPAPAFDALRVWPPVGAVRLDHGDVYERLASRGLDYGADFQGLCGVWTRGEEIFAEVRLPEERAKDAAGFGLHPALLDAALHGLAFCGLETGTAVPFAFTGVWLQATGVAALRVRFAPLPQGGFALAIADSAGEPVASFDALLTRPVSREQLQAAFSTRLESLYRVSWAPVEKASVADETLQWIVLGNDDPATSATLAGTGMNDLWGPCGPDASCWRRCAGRRVAPFAADGAALPRAAHEVTQRALALLQAWTSDERLARSRLVLVTHRAIACQAQETVLDLACAPLWGLVRSAQSQYPDRSIVIVDVDGSAASWSALPQAVACGEPQIALRAGMSLAPRAGASYPRPYLGIPVDTATWSAPISGEGELRQPCAGSTTRSVHSTWGRPGADCHSCSRSQLP